MYFESTAKAILDPCALTIIKLPNANNFCLCEHIDPKKSFTTHKSRLTAHGLTLYHSNPDFVITSKCLRNDFFKNKNITPSDIKNVISLKTSLRSDRRYQLIHEVSTLHILFTTILKVPPPKLTVVTTLASNADRSILKYAAPNSHTANKKTTAVITDLIELNKQGDINKLTSDH